MTTFDIKNKYYKLEYPFKNNDFWEIEIMAYSEMNTDRYPYSCILKNYSRQSLGITQSVDAPRKYFLSDITSYQWIVR